MSRPDRGIQSATEMLPLKGGGVLHIVLTAPRVCWVCILLMHLFKKKIYHLLRRCTNFAHFIILITVPHVCFYGLNKVELSCINNNSITIQNLPIFIAINFGIHDAPLDSPTL